MITFGTIAVMSLLLVAGANLLVGLWVSFFYGPSAMVILLVGTGMVVPSMGAAFIALT